MISKGKEPTTKDGKSAVIQSILDSDLYKFTQQMAVLDQFPNAQAVYTFTNRRPSDRFDDAFFARLLGQLETFPRLELSVKEHEYLLLRCPYLSRTYLEYLSNYQFNLSELKTTCENGNLTIKISGPWTRTILWEVPLMACISECYFYRPHQADRHISQASLACSKAQKLSDAGVQWADFGTRRRRNFDTQDMIVREMKSFKGFVGTSNVHLAMKYNVSPIGTVAHEFIMGCSALDGLRHANRFALQRWQDVFKGNLGTALTDTYGSQSFWRDFDLTQAKLYDGVRQDSGDPFKFAGEAVDHYKKLCIDPTTKTIIFSDSLDVDKVIALKIHCDKLGIRCSFGIGTHLTNDYPDGQALNMVIKLYSITEPGGYPINVAKLSDDEGKATGNPDAVRVAKYMHMGVPL